MELRFQGWYLLTCSVNKTKLLLFCSTNNSSFQTYTIILSTMDVRICKLNKFSHCKYGMFCHFGHVKSLLCVNSVYTCHCTMPEGGEGETYKMFVVDIFFPSFFPCRFVDWHYKNSITYSFPPPPP